MHGYGVDESSIILQSRMCSLKAAIEFIFPRYGRGKRIMVVG